MNLTIESAKAIREEYRESDPTDCYGHQRLAKAVGFIEAWEQRQSEVEGWKVEVEKWRNDAYENALKSEKWMAEADHQAKERDKNFAEIAALKARVKVLTDRLETLANALPPNAISMNVGKALADFQKPQSEAGKP